MIDVDGACKGAPPNTRRGIRLPYTDIKETVAEYYKIADVVDTELVEYRRDLLEIFPRRIGAKRSRSSESSPATALRKPEIALVRSIGRAFHPAEPAPADRSAGGLDRKFRSPRDQAVPAPAGSGLHDGRAGRA